MGRGTKRSAVRVDDAGIRLPRGFSGSADVLFDGRRVWSFSVDRPAADAQAVPWPKRMKRMLDGLVEVRIVAGEREIFAEERQFGTSSERIRLVDSHGHADRGRQVGPDPAAVRGPRPPASSTS